jgi:MFS superfamily sulfate permease-like transporter
VIVVALKGVLLQIPDFLKYWKKSKLDGVLWMTTFIGVVLTTVDMGLIICLAMTVFVMTYRNYQINIMEVDQAAFSNEEIDDNKDSDDENEDNTDNDIEKAEENILALKIIGVLSFANYEKVLKQLNKRLKRQRQKTKTAEGEAPVSSTSS